MKSVFSVRQFLTTPNKLMVKLKKVIGNDFKIDGGFFVPLSYIVLDGKYYQKAKQDLELFAKMIDKIFSVDCQKSKFFRSSFESARGKYFAKLSSRKIYRNFFEAGLRSRQLRAADLRN